MSINQSHTGDVNSKGPVINYWEGGGGLQKGREGASEVLPLQKEGRWKMFKPC